MLKNVVKNAQLDFIQKRITLYAPQLVTSQVSGASTVLTSGFGSGTPNLVELGTSNIGAIKLAAITDEFDFLFLPDDLDNKHPLYIRYLWTSDYGTANGTATFTTLYKSFAVGDAIAAADTALSAVHGASTKAAAAARALYWSKYGKLAPLATGANAGHTLSPATVALAFNVKASAVSGITIGTDFVYVLAVQICYTPRLTFGSSDRAARMLIDGLQPNVELDVTNDI